MVVRLKPLATATREIPPRPSNCASAAASNRCCRSSKYGLNSAYFFLECQCRPPVHTSIIKGFGPIVQFIVAFLPKRRPLRSTHSLADLPNTARKSPDSHIEIDKVFPDCNLRGSRHQGSDGMNQNLPAIDGRCQLTRLRR